MKKKKGDFKLFIIHSYIVFNINCNYFFLFTLYIVGRSSKTNSECGEIEQQQQQQHQQLTQITNNSSSSSIKRPNKVSSICLNIPAVGLGSRPPSIISTDEGGFNEPSPEIKAKLKPAYTFETSALDECQIPSKPIDPQMPPAPLQPDYDPHTLHYVDFGYRLNPDGSESRQIFGESELYQKRNDAVDKYKENNELATAKNSTQSSTNGFSATTTIDTVLYAVIKPEVPPPTELFLDCDYDAINAENEKIYHSPQTMLDPTRPNLSRENILDEFDDYDDRNVVAVNGKCNVIDDDDDDLEQSPPPRPPLPDGPPLDLQDVEYADASDKDDDCCYLADDMTADEAERLLSSR